MNDEQVKAFCLALIKADTEAEVVELLKQAGYWDAPSVWRLYGDKEVNWSTIGNQQPRSDAALVEKLVNSVDACLLNACRLARIHPEDPAAPRTIRQAVARFFGGSETGRISEWPGTKRTEASRDITLAATGARPESGRPCYTISDRGEGQTPEMIPHTLVSLDRGNKIRVPFVQGLFNMGGSGALRFCGRHGLQLILSRRNPALVGNQPEEASDHQWGLTVVRREVPDGGLRSSVYTYLAPMGADENPRKGGVLRFSAASMPIFPEGKEAYVRESEWGTLVKLYEYSPQGYSGTHILRKDGLMGRLDVLLPEVALPIRLHECREYRGHAGSYDTTLTGLAVRLDDDRAENLEPGFPDSGSLSAMGQPMTVRIYAFKKGRAESYRKDEGIVFTLNGQTQGRFTKDFFRRRNVGLSYLADSILIMVDCSQFSGEAREDLFMNNRTQLSDTELRAEIERSLEDMLKHHPGLRSLAERRRREEVETKLGDTKPLEEVLRSLLKQSPTLSEIFLKGNHVSAPFKNTAARAEEKAFEGKRYPTYFRFKGKDYGRELRRDCHINQRCRIQFETDAENGYLTRSVDPGEFRLYIEAGGLRSAVPNHVINLHNGVANLSLDLPANCEVGDEIRFVAVVNDRTQFEPFENPFMVRVRPVAVVTPGNGSTRNPLLPKEGGDRQVPSGIQLPNVVEVYEPGTVDPNAKTWDTVDFDPPFDRDTGLRVKNASILAEHANVYDFYVNMDNIHLKRELKASGRDAQILKARFKFGMVLVGMGLLQEEVQSRRSTPMGGGTGDEGDDEPRLSDINVEDRVEAFTRALAPVLLPMIASLGSIELDDPLVAGSGEAA
ncbi:MAG: hypothetical protein M3Q29_00405 [Chloroflexota bacterium]|nr:hypothetical protein [Chloroflexota bacterium]